MGRSVTMNGRVRGVLREMKRVCMLDGDRSLSSFVVKDVDRTIANARTRVPARSASSTDRNA